MMPDIEGIEICRMLREKASERYTYILLLTSKSEKVELVQGMNAGADDYIVKPFDSEELKVRLAAGRRIIGLQEDLLAMRGRLKSGAGERDTRPSNVSGKAGDLGSEQRGKQ